MSNLIPPLLSSSPPPIVGPLDEDDDDEFGDFRVAADSFDCDDFSLPPSPHKSPKELKSDLPKVNLDINSNKSQNTEMPIETEEVVCEEVEKDFQDRRKSEGDEIKINSSDQEQEINGFDVDFSSKIDDFSDLQCAIPNSVTPVHPIKDNEVESELNSFSNDAFSESNHETNEIKSDGDSEEISERDNDINSLSEPSASVSLKLHETEEEFGNFEASSPQFGNFETHFNNDVEEDEFDDFVEPPAPTQDDDFGDFESSNEKPAFLQINHENAFEKSETVLKENFPPVEEKIDDFEPMDYTKDSRIFDELKDVTETNALIYQWSKSNSQKMFLKALNIDTRNILYGPAWSSSMSRFAGLEPIKPEILTPTPIQNEPNPSNSSQKPGADIPTAQFDWSGSGLINPLDSASTELPGNVPEDSPQPQVTDFLPPTPAKPQPIPDLGIFEPEIQSKQTSPAETESKINDFSPFESPKLIPLRETHISNEINDVSKPGWLQPTILTPDLPRKEPIQEPDDDEFDDFQMVLPEVNGTKQFSEFEKPNEIKKVEIEDEDEFTEFHASVPPQPEILKPLEPLEPVRLEPPKPSTAAVTQINWPEPGVTDEDIRNIELSYSVKPVEEDEWSDFVSVNPRTATPDLPLSVLNLNSVQAPKQPIPVITPSGLVQTKLSSNIPPSVVQTSVQRTMYRPPTSQFQPSLISSQFAAKFPDKCQDDDDDWSDFVSGQLPLQPQNGYQKAATNIIMNPTHAFQGYGPPKMAKSAIPSISAMPDLDFIAPKNRTKK